jgi:hypothetical protein
VGGDFMKADEKLIVAAFVLIAFAVVMMYLFP